MSNRLGWGIIGCGVIAPTHADAFRRIEGVELVRACDLVQSKAEELAERYGITHTCADFRELCADPGVDCVSICTDHASHAKIAAAALDAGKHVLCEKPLAISHSQLAHMLAAHRRNSGKVFAAVFQHRFDTVYRGLKSLIEKRVFGDLLTVSVNHLFFRSNEYYRADPWRGKWATEGGAVLINQSIHFIDIITWIMGGVESVCAAHVNVTRGGVIEAEDTAALALRFRSGCLGTFSATSSSHKEWTTSLAVCGSRGLVELRDGAVLRTDFIDAAAQAEANAQLSAVEKPSEIGTAKPYYGPSHTAQVADFVDAVRQGRKPFVEACSAAESVQVVLAAYRSARTGRWERVKRN